jgi:ABC-type transporter Mla subunit MlaD
MALQDLTPQLRTRLDRVERIVGLFVGLAVVLMLAGFGYYLYHTAERKGWLVAKVPYFTFLDTATGLQVGDPVRLMGFTVGEITVIESMPPEAYGYNVYVEFLVNEKYSGYLWTEGSLARVATADLLGKRVIEVTKGTNGLPTYLFWKYEQRPLAELQAMREDDLQHLVLAVPIRDQATNELAKPLTALTPGLLEQCKQAAVQSIALLNTRERSRKTPAIWDRAAQTYRPWRAPDKPYGLDRDESSALTERLDQLATLFQQNLPSFLDLTNRLASVLGQADDTLRQADELFQETRLLASNLVALSSHLREQPGALGEWLLPTNINRNLELSLVAATTTLTHTDARLEALTTNLQRSLDHVADLTLQVNRQLEANTNLLSHWSGLVTNSDQLVQGLKRHWLLRSAFKEKPTNAPPRERTILRSPKQQSMFR